MTGMFFSFAWARTVPRESPSIEAMTRTFAPLILQVDLVAGLLEHGLHVLAVLVPALQVLRGHRHADQITARSGGGGGLAAGGQREDHAECQNKCKNFFHRDPPFSF